MHSRPHHEAIERLKGGQQVHKCWACDVSVLGLEQFRMHIEAEEHKSELLALTQRTQSGFTVDYDDVELNALSAQRDHQRFMFKQQKRKEKQKRFREKMAAIHQDAFSQTSQMKHKGWRTPPAGFVPPGSHATAWKWDDGKTAACPLNNENVQRTMNAEPDFTSVRDERDRYERWNGYPRQPPMQSVMQSMTEDVDYTRDQDTFCSWENADGSWETSRKRDNVGPDHKRSREAQISEPPTAKRQCFRDVPSLIPSDCGENVEGERVNERTSDAGAAPGHVDQLSSMLTDIRRSLDEKRLRVRLSEDPCGFRSVTDDGPKPNERVQETPLSDVSHFPKKHPKRLSTKSQTCQTETFKTKRNPSPSNQVNSLPASGAEPQENPDLTQTRNVLPALLSRSVSKMEANKPNLKVARGIRTSQKPSQAGESRVLKPALQKLISSKSSEWRVNWKEIYQEATHRKLQKEKGMPRFGIELVSPLPPDPQDLAPEDLPHFELDEGFQWASVETRPRSNEDARRFPPAETCPNETRDPASSNAGHTSWPVEPLKREAAGNRGSLGTTRASGFVPDRRESGDINADNTSQIGASGRQDLTPVVCVKTEKPNDYCTNPTREKSENEIQCIPVKQNKQDVSNADTQSKNPPKNQVNELLVMSLREDELCSSLEDVESRLLQAQATLQTAFLEVQRLQVVKQQVTAEMSSLRSKRINILQRIK
ncbi:zinc finger protein, partial [Clarias magur]